MHRGGCRGPHYLWVRSGQQARWNLPTAYPSDNLHSENLIAFAKDVAAATGGKLQITGPRGASLFKAPEIKRAVQTGQAQIGEILISIHENEDPIFGIDVVPFLATSFDDARKLWKASRPAIEKKLAAQGMMRALRGALGAAGHLRQEGHQHDRRHEGR